ncbi:Uncharacterized protein SCF082_LOCUS35627 [Durusdinium trenchii]|uniref:Uncharacterized protein n=1 Tax=Durusdinium trenchii TaxID=1381693 RepID=A0ABP0P9S0_9DINO
MVVLSSTLGCRQGTLYRAPRGAEAKLADDNVFCKNRFWTELTCQATDKEDGAQWFSAPATIKSILTACLSKVSTVKGQICVIHHYSMYEGAFEKVAIGLMTELQSNAYLACYSETAHPLLFQFALGQVKDKLLEDSLNVQMLEWKGGTGLTGAFSPKFCPEPDQSALMVPRMPELKLCRMVGNGHLEIPQEVRAKWLGDPVRSTWVRYQNRVSIPFSILKGLKGICCLVEFNFCVLIQDPDWRVRLKNFDSVFAPTDNPTAAPAPEPVPQDANKDLGQDLPTPERAVDGQKLLTPPALSKEDFDAQYKDCEVKAVTLSVGAQNLTRSIVNDKVYLSATMNSPSRLLGVQTPSSKPLFLYAGGSWVMRQPCKAKDFLSKEANQNKAVEFRLSSGDELVCLEEQSPQGLVDIGPFTVYKMFVGYEKGMMDLKLTGHGFNRPPAVQRGEESDRIIVAHEAHSVFKPNAVNQKNLRGTNIAGYIGYKVLIPGLRHYPREKVVGPAKPLWFAKGDIVLQPSMQYQIA